MSKPGPREIEARAKREAQYDRDQAAIKAAKKGKPVPAKVGTEKKAAKP